ncbi:hypothetical protein LTR16_007660, partial [Cryomyces antarcticus]
QHSHTRTPLGLVQHALDQQLNAALPALAQLLAPLLDGRRDGPRGASEQQAWRDERGEAEVGRGHDRAGEEGQRRDQEAAAGHARGGRGKVDFGGMGKVGGTRRVFLKGADTDGAE